MREIQQFRCPICTIVFHSFSVRDGAERLAAHLQRTHNWYCPCGAPLPIRSGLFDSAFPDALAEHIASFDDYLLHVAEAELLKLARERRTNA